MKKAYKIVEAVTLIISGIIFMAGSFIWYWTKEGYKMLRDEDER